MRIIAIMIALLAACDGGDEPTPDAGLPACWYLQCDPTPSMCDPGGICSCPNPDGTATLLQCIDRDPP
jgi:hypothetical protein